MGEIEVARTDVLAALQQICSNDASKFSVGQAQYSELSRRALRRPVGNLIDGDETTRWISGGPQRGAEWLGVELAAVADVTGVELVLGVYRMDFPRELVIELSTNGRDWAPVWRGSTAGVALRAALENHADLPMRFTFAPQPARFIRLRQIAEDLNFHWSVVELRILPP